MAHPLPKYANVAPTLHGKERKPSICVSCKCTNCQEIESCSSCSLVNGGYLRTVPDEKPPVPCRQRRFTDDFSPEMSFCESKRESDIPKLDTKRMKEMDIQLPLPLSNAPDIPPNLQSHQTPRLSQHQDWKPSDDFPVPNATVSTQLITHTKMTDAVPGHITEKKTDRDQVSQSDITLPKRKSDIRKRRKRENCKVHMWMKGGTIISIVLLIGLSYLVLKSITDIFFVSHHYERPSRHKWNYSEPHESKLYKTICFSCDVINEFKGQRSKFDLYGFRSTGNRQHCCLDQLGHVKWLVSMMKTNEILQHKVNNNTSTKACSVKATFVPIENGNKTGLKLNNAALHTQCRGASINVTEDALVVRKDGLYIVYMTMSVTLAPSQSDGKSGNIALRAHLYCSKSKKGKCIEMETFNKTMMYSDTHFHVFNLYTVKKFTHGEHLYPVLSEPRYLYRMQYGNFIGVVEL